MLLILLYRIFIISLACYLTVTTNNRNWMWLLLLLLTSPYIKEDIK